jgi:sugar lactone lactonase YvrE/uncharacterized protein YciI
MLYIQKFVGAIARVVGSVMLLAPIALASEEPTSMTLPAIVQPPTQLVPAESLETYPKGYFLENIVVDVDGTIYITENTTGQILRYRPTTGEADVFGSVEAQLAGLGLDIDGTLVATGHTETNSENVYQFAADGTVETVISIPEAEFLNGMALLQPGVFLVADSRTATIWRVDINTQQAMPWLQHETLAPNSQAPVIPGANGIKLFNGAVYVTNSGQAHVVRIPLNADGSAGEPTVIFDNIVLDDFAFGRSGSLYGTTHIFNSVVRITPDGQRQTIATGEQGVTGSTALAFGSLESDRRSVYVVGDGGIFSATTETDIIPPELVRLEIGEAGMTQESALDWMARPQTVEAIETQLVQCATAPDTDTLRTTVGPQYLRYLELNLERISYAGQLYASGTDNPPTARLYFIESSDPQAALELMQRSPYSRAGVYSNCQVTPFRALLGNTIGGVSWPNGATLPNE